MLLFSPPPPFFWGLEILFENLFLYCFGERILMKLQLLKKHLTLLLQPKKKKKKKDKPLFVFILVFWGFD